MVVKIAKYSISITILFLSFVGVPNIVVAQSIQYKFDQIDVKSGLTHNAVTSIIMDRKGFMWFGTHGGLNKYDGFKVIQYRNENDNTNSLPTNSILSLYEDARGILWIGSYGAGLIRFDPASGIFSRHAPPANDNGSPPFTVVRCIFEDKNKIVWLGTNQGLVRFNTEKGTFTTFVISKQDARANDITSIYEGYSGNFWIATQAGLWKFDRNSLKFSRLHNSSALSDQVIQSVYEDQAGTLWIGTSGGGLNKVNPSNNKFIHFRSSVNDRLSISSDIINDIKQFDPGKLVIATENGINVLDLKTEKFEHIKIKENLEGGLSHNIIHCLYKDRNEVLWVGTSGGGVNKTDRMKKKFFHYQHEPGNPKSLSNNNVFAIQEDHFGKIWVGTIGGGLNRFDPKTKNFTRISFEGKNHKPDKILSLSIGPSRNLWIGTDLDGLFMIPAAELSKDVIRGFVNFRESAKENSLSSNVIYSVLEDNTNTVWAGTWASGLNKITSAPEHPKIIQLRYNNTTTSVSHDIIFTMHQDKSGVLWIGTAGGGLNKHEALSRFDNEKTEVADSFTPYISDPQNSNSISDNFVAAIYESEAGDLWIGTTTGLNKMDRKLGTFKSYTQKHGLPSNVVFGILEDKDGNLWLGTHGGLSKFNPHEETFRNYSIEDGLQGLVFNPDAYCLSSTGEMFFGGTNGITVFYPDSLEDNPFKPVAMITNLHIQNKEGKETIWNNVAVKEEIELTYEDYIFSVEFAASTYSIPTKNKFAYKLEGFNTDWIHTDASNRIAMYTNLDPGTYTFKVKASNPDGVWNENPTSLQIRILPPYWETFWFKALVATGIISMLFLLYYWRISAIKNQKLRLERIVQQRTEEIVTQNEQLVEQQDELESQRNALASQNKEIEEKNILLENQQLHLEKLVDERTLELMKKNMELQDKNQRFEEYGFMTSHNFRGPVASLLGLCNIFNREDLSDKQNLLFIQKIEETTLKIDEMIRDLSFLLDQETHLENLYTQVKLNEVVQNVKTLLAQEIKDTGAIIRSDFSRAPVIGAVPAYITSIFYNLISNAIKFRKENTTPEIELRSSLDSGLVMITFKDNGTGINLNKHAASIFHPFKRFHTHVAGKGLGLYLVKAQVKAMEGDIQIESEVEIGTTFKLILRSDFEPTLQ